MKTGEFEVLQRRKGVNIRVNMKRRGDTFGEVALMFNCPRSATVAATQGSVVWVLEREAFRQYVREVQESESSQLELFLNSGADPAAGRVGRWRGRGAALQRAGGRRLPLPCAKLAACMALWTQAELVPAVSQLYCPCHLPACLQCLSLRRCRGMRS